MNRIPIKSLFAGALLAVTALIAGCKDYDDDINGLQSQIDDLKTGQIASINEQIEKINSSLDNLNGMIPTLTETITDMQKAIAELKEADKALGGRIDGVESRLEEAVADLQQQIDANAGDITALRSALESKLAELKKYIDDELYGEEGLWPLLNMYLTDLYNNLEGYGISDPEADDGWLTLFLENINVLNSNINFVYDLVKGNTTDITALKEQVKSLTESLGALTSDFTAFKAEMSGNIERLDGQVTRLEEFRSQLENVIIPGLEQQIEDNRAAFDEFTRQTLDAIAALTSRIDDIVNNILPTLATRDELNALRSEVAGWLGDYVKKEVFDARVGALEGALADQIARIDGMIRRLDGHEGRIAALEGELGTLKEDLGSLREEFDAFKENVAVQISTAITELEGRIDEKISEAISGLKAELTAQIDAIRQRLDDLENRMDAAEIDIEALIGRIQSIVYVPEYSDGKITVSALATATGSEAYLVSTPRIAVRYEIRPADVVADLVTAWKADRSILDFNTLDVRTRSASDSGAELKITDLSGNGGILTIEAEPVGFNIDFFNNRDISYSVALVVSYANNGNVVTDMSSGFTNLKSRILPMVSFTFVRSNEDGSVELITPGSPYESEVAGFDFPYNDTETAYNLFSDKGDIIYGAVYDGGLYSLEGLESLLNTSIDRTQLRLVYNPFLSAAYHPAFTYEVRLSDIDGLYNFTEAGTESTLSLAANDPKWVTWGVKYAFELFWQNMAVHESVIRFASQVTAVPTVLALNESTLYWKYGVNDGTRASYEVAATRDDEHTDLQGLTLDEIFAVTPTVYTVAADETVTDVTGDVTFARNGTGFTVTFAGDFMKWNETYTLKAVYALPASDVTLNAVVKTSKPEAYEAALTGAPVDWTYNADPLAQTYTVALGSPVKALWNANTGMADNFTEASAASFIEAVMAGQAAGTEGYDLVQSWTPTDLSGRTGKYAWRGADRALDGTPFAAAGGSPYISFDPAAGPEASLLLGNGSTNATPVENSTIVFGDNKVVIEYTYDGVTLRVAGSAHVNRPVYTVQPNSLKIYTDGTPAVDGYAGQWMQLIGRYDPTLPTSALARFTIEDADLYEGFNVYDASGRLIPYAEYAGLGLGIEFTMSGGDAGTTLDQNWNAYTGPVYATLAYRSRLPYVSVAPKLKLAGEDYAGLTLSAFRVYPVNPIATSVRYVGNDEIEVTTIGTGQSLYIPVWRTITLYDNRPVGDSYPLFDVSAASFADYSATVTGDGSNGFAAGTSASDAYGSLTVAFGQAVKAYVYNNDVKGSEIRVLSQAGLSFDASTGILTYTNNNIQITSNVLVEIPVTYEHAWGTVDTESTPVRIVVRR